MCWDTNLLVKTTKKGSKMRASSAEETKMPESYGASAVCNGVFSYFVLEPGQI